MTDDIEATAETRDPETARPWHGSDNPLVSLHDWMIAELAKVSGGDKLAGLEARVAKLEEQNAALKSQAERAAHELIDVKDQVAAVAEPAPVQPVYVEPSPPATE